MEVRARWVAKYGSDHLCHYCGVEVTDDDFKIDEGMARKLTLDHLETRSGNPELRYIDQNLVPACGPCNRKKGSKSHDNYVHVCRTPIPYPLAV